MSKKIVGNLSEKRIKKRGNLEITQMCAIAARKVDISPSSVPQKSLSRERRTDLSTAWVLTTSGLLTAGDARIQTKTQKAAAAAASLAVI